MKPYPFASLNHFTVPVAIKNTSSTTKERAGEAHTAQPVLAQLSVRTVAHAHTKFRPSDRSTPVGRMSVPERRQPNVGLPRSTTSYFLPPFNQDLICVRRLTLPPYPPTRRVATSCPFSPGAFPSAFSALASSPWLS